MIEGSIGATMSRDQTDRYSPVRNFGRFLRIADVVSTTGLSRPTIYRLVQDGSFPKQHALTPRCVGWWEDDVASWLAERRGIASA